MESLAELTERVAHPGRVAWIGLRPARKAQVLAVARARLDAGGLEGDHRARPGKRALSLIQAEHLEVIRALSAAAAVEFADLRRNVAISGVNLSAMRGRHLRLGTALVRITGPCAPCSRMEAILGPGGYTAMRGHGGMVAEVIEPGLMAIGDRVEVIATDGNMARNIT